MFEQLIISSSFKNTLCKLISNAVLTNLSCARCSRALYAHIALAESESGKLYEFPAVTKVDGLPPAASYDRMTDHKFELACRMLMVILT